jgi:5'-3' exonuclease
MFLNSIRSNRKKFHDEYGEIVICADGKNSWRKTVFPYYKSNRKKSREESELDWNELFRIMGVIRDELNEYFPYKVLHFDSLEADDVIGIICNNHGRMLNDGSEKFLILSGDKDYIQLHKYANVKQYSPTMKKWIENSNPDKYLTEHILRGDKGDGIPNILSPDNCIAVGERQKPMTAKRIQEFITNPDSMDEITKHRFERNKKLIDLDQIPDQYKDLVTKTYDTDKGVRRSGLMNFFMSRGLKNLMTDIQDF